MKKVAKAMYGKSMMKTGGKVGPIEGIKLRMQAAKEARQMKKNNEKMEELRNAQKSKPEMNYTNPYTPKGKKGMVVKTKYKTGGKVTAKKMEMGGMSSGTMMKDLEMKMGGAKKLKMMKGGAKPKAMYGASMKPGMMKMGGTKKKQSCLKILAIIV